MALIQLIPSKESYKSLCEEMKEILTQEKDLAARKEQIRKQIIEEADGERMEFGIKVAFRSSKGSVDYKKYVTALDVDQDILDLFRGKTREYWEVRSY